MLTLMGFTMRWRLACSICFAATLFGGPPETRSPAFDDDLFKRDAQVISVHGEFLFWRVQEGALDYALKMRSAAWGPSTSYAQGKFEKATYNGDPGFRIATSFFRAPKYWEIWAVYTRLTARGQNSASKPEPTDQFITGTWPQVTTAPLSGATSRIHLNYNVADLLIDRWFSPNPHLRLRMLGGAGVAWINQDWKIHYNDAAGRVTKVRNRWSYTGGGFRMGTSIDWYWQSDFYVTASATTAVLMGTYRNRAEQTTDYQPTAADNTSVPIRKADFRDARPVFSVQAYLGPSWQKNFPKNRVEVFVGYEMNVWFNLQEVYRSTGGGPSDAKETWINTGLLTLQGLTTRVTVDF